MDANSSGAADYSTESGRNPGLTLTDQAVRGFVNARDRRAHSMPWDGPATSRPEDRPRLSADFVEALMGFPPAWSIARTDSGASATPSIRWWLRAQRSLLRGVLSA